jgi:carboxymethylenebutenolidase
MIPQPEVDAVRKALDETGTGHEVVVYPDADHGFNCDRRASFHADSAKDAWARTLALFSSEL